MVGAPLLIRALGAEGCDARLTLEYEGEAVHLDCVGGALHCLRPSAGERRSGALSARTLARLLERSSAISAQATPLSRPLESLLAQPGLSADERRAGIHALLVRISGWHEGKFELSLQPPPLKLLKSVEAEKTLAFSPNELLRGAARQQPSLRLRAPDQARRVEGAGEGLRVFLEVASARRLNGTLSLRGSALLRTVLFVSGAPHGAHAASLAREDLDPLVAWGGLSFDFVPKRPRETPPPLPEGLLDELAHQAASWKALLALVVGPAAVFRFVDEEAELESSQVFGLEGLVGSIDGRRSLSELIAASGQPTLEVIRTLADLVTLGFVQRVR